MGSRLVSAGSQFQIPGSSAEGTLGLCLLCLAEIFWELSWSQGILVGLESERKPIYTQSKSFVIPLAAVLVLGRTVLRQRRENDRAKRMQ